MWRVYPLLLISVLGLMLTASAADLLVVYLGLEMAFLPLWALTLLGHSRGTGVECGGVKFVLLGLYGSGRVLFATALLYCAAGDTGLQLLVESLSSPVVDDKLVVSAVVLLLAGLFLKLGAAPVTLGHPTCVREARSWSQSLSPPRVLRRWGASCFMFCSRSKICGCPCWKPRRC